MASGNFTGVNQTVVITSTGDSLSLFQFSGTFVGISVEFDMSPDGTNWAPCAGSCGVSKVGLGGGGSQAYAFALTDNALAEFVVSGVPIGNQVRAKCTAFTSGSCAVLASSNSPPAGSGSTIQVVPGTSGGVALPYRNINLVATGVSVKGSAGQVYGWLISNNAASARFLKLYNKATAPVVGTDVPVITLEIPASSTGQFFIGTGIAFPLGIGVGATQLVADNDTTAPNANDVILNLFYD